MEAVEVCYEKYTDVEWKNLIYNLSTNGIVPK